MRKFLILFFLPLYLCAYEYAGVLPYHFSNGDDFAAYVFLSEKQTAADQIVYGDIGSVKKRRDKSAQETAERRYKKKITNEYWQNTCLKANRGAYRIFTQHTEADDLNFTGVWIESNELLKAVQYAMESHQIFNVWAIDLSGEKRIIQAEVLKALIRDMKETVPMVQGERLPFLLELRR